MARDDRVHRITSVEPSVEERQRPRRRLYVLMMGVCLVLILLAWNVVRFWSIPLAVGMSVVAMVLPPIAAFVANRGEAGG